MSGAKESLLLIEDDPVMGGSLVQRLRLEGFEVLWVRTAQEGLNALRRRSHHAVISDIKLPDRSGEDLYKDAIGLLGRTPIVFVTAYADLTQAVRLVQAGANDYLQKPFSIEQLVARLRQLIAHSSARRRETGDDLSTLAPALASVSDTLRRVADIEAPVLIAGETGVGKEIAARYLRQASVRRTAPFVAVNCAAIPRELIESAMFGHEKGAFTSAHARHIGYFEEAADGILFLDEIGDLNPHLQAVLLRTIQERTFRRVGGANDIAFRGRLVSATNVDLRHRIALKEFREDLFYRLAVVEVHIPPLRERLGDIAKLAEYFLRDAAERFSKPTPELAAEAREALLRHTWPGNVRELKNRIERSVALADRSVITELDLFPDQTLKLPQGSGRPLLDARSDAERREIAVVLASVGGRVGEAARKLGISRTTLWKRMKTLGLASSESSDVDDAS